MITLGAFSILRTIPVEIVPEDCEKARTKHQRTIRITFYAGRYRDGIVKDWFDRVVIVAGKKVN